MLRRARDRGRGRAGGPAARLPRHGTRRREDVRDAPGGASPRCARDRPRRRLRRGARTAADRGAARRASRSSRVARSPTEASSLEEMDTDAVIARRPRLPWSTSWRTPTPLVRRGRSAGRTSTSSATPASTSSAPATCSTSSRSPMRSRRSSAPLSTSVCRTTCCSRADEIELVDMSPRALRQRMRHGNVYAADRAQVALDRFFTEANLTALRELALRYVAERVDAQLEGIMSQRVESPARGRCASACSWWSTTVRRRSVVGSARSEPGRSLSRAADRDLVRGRGRPSVPHDRGQDVREHLEFAEELGATVVRPAARDPIDGSWRRHASAERPRCSSAATSAMPVPVLMRRSFADELERLLPDLELHLIGAAHCRHEHSGQYSAHADQARRRPPRQRADRCVSRGARESDAESGPAMPTSRSSAPTRRSSSEATKAS